MIHGLGDTLAYVSVDLKKVTTYICSCMILSLHCSFIYDQVSSPLSLFLYFLIFLFRCMCSVCSYSGCERRQIIAADVSMCVSMSWLDTKSKAYVSMLLPSLYKYIKSIHVVGDVATGGNGISEICVQLGFGFRPVGKTGAQFYFSLRHACVYQSDSNMADCREIVYFRFLLNSVPTPSFLLKPDKRAKYVYDLSPSSVVVIVAGCVLCEVSVDVEEKLSRRSSQRKTERKSKVQLRTGHEGSQVV